MELWLVDLRWGVEQRMEYIEFRLFWDGAINRADIVGHFGVSVPQASADLARYQTLAPGNVRYDSSRKQYTAEDSFQPRISTPSAGTFFARSALSVSSDAWTPRPVETDLSETPERKIDPYLLRSIVRAVREARSLEIHYQSMNSKRPAPLWRSVTPHAFGFDGHRWHVRAFCHLDRNFQDFLVPRILKTRGTGAPGPLGLVDLMWHRTFDVQIAPHPGLSEPQKAAVAADYGMVGGVRSFPVRYAMLFYVLRKLGLLDNAERRDSRVQHIILVNRGDAEKALQLADLGDVQMDGEGQ